MPSPPSWCAPPARLSLADGEVHVWRVPLDRTGVTAHYCFSVLTPDERHRAARFHFRTDRERFIIARGMLRTIIGRYLHLNPGQLRFDYNPYGKPALAGGDTVETLRFNLSHSHQSALYAFTLTREIGVDLEYLRPDFVSEQIAGRVFSASEIEIFRSLPAHRRTEAFFNCWARKEAYLKARGKGLALSLRNFDVSFLPGEPARLLCVRGEGEEARRWSLRALTPETGYVAAVAVEGSDWRLKCWRWTE